MQIFHSIHDFCSSSYPISRPLQNLFCLYEGYTLYRLFESALSHLLALHQLRHGTSPINYVKISRQGLVPEKAAKSDGEAAYFEVTDPERNKGERESLVYVMRDVSAHPCKCPGKYPMCEDFTYTKRKAVHEYAYQSGAAMLAFKKNHLGMQRFFMRLGGLAGLCTPTLKFHFEPDDLGILEEDPWLRCIAFRTNKPISAERLGLMGAMKIGFNRRLGGRVQKDPKRSLIGLIQLIVAVALTLKFVKNLRTQPNLSNLSLLIKLARAISVSAIAS